MATRTEARWTELGDEAAVEDWRAGNRGAATSQEIRAALADHFDVDLHDSEITSDVEAAVESATRGYIAEYRRLGGDVSA